MNHLQEWALMFVLGRDMNGQKTKGGDLFGASQSVGMEDVRGLVEEGYLTLEQTNVIPSRQSIIGASTFLNITEKGRGHFKKQKPN